MEESSGRAVLGGSGPVAGEEQLDQNLTVAPGWGPTQSSGHFSPVALVGEFGGLMVEGGMVNGRNIGDGGTVVWQMLAAAMAIVLAI